MDPYAARTPEDEYPTPAVLGAAIATFFFPVISLIAALMLMSGQRSEPKRGQLRTWAWASAAWLLLQLVLFVFLLVGVAAGGSGTGDF
jgi:hypothetical protein